MTMAYKVFISYPRTSTCNFIADTMRHALEDCGAKAFLDSLIPPGLDFEKEILDNLVDCNELWVLMTPPLNNLITDERISGSIERPFMMLEVGAAWHRNIPIVPILVGYSQREFAEDKNIPNVIKNKQAVELNSNDYKQLLVSIKEISKKTRRLTNRIPLKESIKDRRRANRIPLNLPIAIISEDDRSTYVAAIIEFSEDGSGCFVETNKRYSINDTIEPTFSAKIVHVKPKKHGKSKIPGMGINISKSRKATDRET